jgi:hypothetical protein
MMKISTPRSATLIYSTIALLMLGPMPVAVSAQGEGSTAGTRNEANLEEKNLSVFGRNIGFQPRFYTGAMYYQYEQDAVVQEATPPPGFTGAFVASTPFEFKTTFPIVGGGGTFFTDQFFVDLYAQHAFSQSDSNDQNTFTSRTLASAAGNASETTQLNAREDTKAERTEWAISAGYAVTDNFSLFGGYRSADTDFDTKQSGKFSQDELAVVGVQGGSQRLTADQTADLRLEFDQDGPFVGFVYGIPVKKGMFDGLIAFDLAVAFLNGKVTQTSTNGRRTNVQQDGNPLPDQTTPDSTVKLDGDAIGLNLGFHWRGLTPVEGLSYLIDVVTHRYDFSADESIVQSTGQSESRLRGEAKYNEVVVSARVGLAYTF